MVDDRSHSVLIDIRNLIRAASYESIKAALESALPDAKSRKAYQMFDGKTSMDRVRVACKMSPNALVTLAQRCTAMGLMELNGEKKRLRLFNLADFGIVAPEQ